MSDLTIGRGRFMLGDCLERMAELPDASVDMILCDLPYGTTQNKWDAVIPFEPLWEQYWRVAKPGAAVVLTAAQPFTSALVMSQPDFFKYDWTWEKAKATGHLNAKRAPLRAHESVLIFAKSFAVYEPQKAQGRPYKASGGSSKNDNYGQFAATREGSKDGSRYPRSVIVLSHETKPIHPTQKPVSLFEYFILTYTIEGMTILDNCAGSGTTAIAAERTGRNWICIERDQTYFDKACERVRNEVASRGLFA